MKRMSSASRVANDACRKGGGGMGVFLEIVGTIALFGLPHNADNTATTFAGPRNAVPSA